MADANTYFLKTVRPIFKGEMVEMQKSADDLWGPVELHKSENVGSSLPYIQIIMKFYLPNECKSESKRLVGLPKYVPVMPDVQIIVKRKPFGAHVAVLSSASPVLAAMIEQERNANKGSESLRIELKDVEPIMLRQILLWMYQGVVPETWTMPESLLVAVNTYQIEHLKQLLTNVLISTLTVDNVIGRVKLSHKHSISGLLEASLNFLVDRQEKIREHSEWKQLVKKEPEVFLLITDRMFAKLSRKRKLEECFSNGLALPKCYVSTGDMHFPTSGPLQS